MPSLREQTVRVNIASADSLKTRRDVHIRFMKGFRVTTDRMYSDPHALGMYADFANARRLRDEFFARSALDPDIVRGLDQLMAEAVNFRYLQAPLAAGDFAELVQVPLK